MITLDTTVKYTGPDIESLGIKNGMRLSDVLTYLFSFSEKSKNPVIQKKEDVYTSSIIHNKPSTSGLSVNAVLFQSKKALYVQSLSAESIIFSFDYSDVYLNVPEGFYIKEPKTRFVGLLKDGGTIVRENNDRVGVIHIPLTRIPGSVETEIMVGSEFGDMAMRLSITISELTDTTVRVGYFQITDYTNSGENMMLNTYLNYISNSIDKLVSDISFLNKYKKDDTVGVVAAIEKLYSVVNEIKGNQFNTVLIPGTNTRVTLQEMVNHLYRQNDPILLNVDTISGFVTQLTNENIFTFLSTGKKVVLFYTNNCSTCQEKISEFENVASSINSYIFAKIDISEHQSIGQHFSIIENPTVIIFESGAEIERVNILSLEQRLNNI